MRAAHVREHVAPVIVVLNEIALREADAVGLAAIGVDSVHRNGRNRVVLGAAAQHAFHPALTGSDLVQRVRREGVSPGCLSGDLPRVVQSRELRHRRGCAGLQAESGKG